VRPERVVGLVAFWSGVGERPEEMTAGEFCGALEGRRIPREAITFAPEHEAWLLKR
jgi:hypothetical protein